MKKVISSALVVTLLLMPGLSDWKHVKAESLDDVKDEINDLEKEKNQLNDKQGNISSEKEETEEKIEENLSEQDQVKSEINSIDQKLNETKKAIQSKENEISKTNKEIEQLKKDIKELQKRIKEREKLLKDRLRTIQQNGGDMRYIEVIFGAQSFGDFISRSTAVNTIMDQDKNIMETHAAEKKELEEKKVEVEEKKASLEGQKKELESLKSQLDEQIAEKEKLMSELEEQHAHLEEYKMSLAEEQELLRSQEAALQKALKLAEQQKDELEQLAKEQAAQSSTSASTQSTPSAGGNGLFSWPASGYVTSGMGMRWGSVHAGIDIGNSTASSGGDVPIRAAASGVVTRAYTSSSYGNVVFITHVIDGKQYETVYAHMKYPPLVSTLQTVQKGQQIGVMGSTGNSTGPHLHFEIHSPKWNGSKSNRVNPLNYLN